MTHDDLDRLEAAAKKATPGPWVSRKYGIHAIKSDTDWPVVVRDPDDEIPRWEDKEYIANCDPDTILELVAGYRKGLEAEKVVEAAKQLTYQTVHHADNCKHPFGCDCGIAELKEALAAYDQHREKP